MAAKSSSSSKQIVNKAHNEGNEKKNIQLNYNNKIFFEVHSFHLHNM